MQIRCALAASVALLWIDRAEAQSGRPVRQPTAASTQGLCEQFAPEERAHMPGEAERAVAQARMEALYRRLDDHADRAARSICQGCQPDRLVGVSHRRLVASAQQPENLVGDPAQAPDY
ncbi:hypothetical protein Mpop_3138 [Methylorubrum populi BJ001]|jgi:hypothetical protein|uniref:Uncharacterized protein n=2 Tax=Methylorubrum populi TaxID=223967 RepID=B1ZGQ7_METPB|nr:hypothetical protein Mpop_3138 [Methylorubrum populi BJ001]OAH38054.1 hypothetical protein AX289_18670 [Methylorubrum populi]PZP66937.1 MAG: hypothetical protein DI590_22365 [Methylorubrum populi]